MSELISGLFQLDEDTLNAGGFACDVINMALHWGVLKPDARLQAIADAWKRNKQRDAGTDEWLELKFLLDALVEGEPE